MVDPVLVLPPSLVRKVALPSLAASSTRYMGKSQISAMVLPAFWLMIFMGVKENHTKYEQETQKCKW